MKGLPKRHSSQGSNHMKSPTSQRSNSNHHSSVENDQHSHQHTDTPASESVDQHYSTTTEHSNNDDYVNPENPIHRSFEMPSEEPKHCGTSFPKGLPTGRGPGGDYPANPPPYEIPHNVFRFLKKIPKKLLPKIARLFHLDTVFQEILLATISIDDEDVRKTLLAELDRLVDELNEPIQRLGNQMGKSLAAVFRAIPGLNIIYAISDLTESYKEVNEVGNQVMSPLNQFVENVKEVYDNSVESNRLLSSMIYAGIETVNDPKLKELLEKKRDASVGRAAVGEVQDRPKDKEMARLTASVMSREMQNKTDPLVYESLIKRLKSTQDFDNLYENIKGKESMEQQDTYGKGPSLLSFITGRLDEKAAEIKAEEETERNELAQRMGNTPTTEGQTGSGYGDDITNERITEIPSSVRNQMNVLYGNAREILRDL